MGRIRHVAALWRKNGREKGGGFARHRGSSDAHFALQRGKRVHQKLAEIGEGDGIGPRDAAMGKLPDDVSQIQVNGTCGREIAHASKQLDRGGLRILRKGGLLQTEVTKTETGLIVQNAEAATAACVGDVSTARFSLALRRAGYNGLIGHGWILR